MPRPCKVCGGLISDHDCCMNTRDGEAIHPGCWLKREPIPADHNCDVAGCPSVAHNMEKLGAIHPFEVSPLLSRLALLEKVLEAAGALLESMRMADRLNSQEARTLEKRIEEVEP